MPSSLQHEDGSVDVGVFGQYSIIGIDVERKGSRVQGGVDCSRIDVSSAEGQRRGSECEGGYRAVLHNRG